MKTDNQDKRQMRRFRKLYVTSDYTVPNQNKLIKSLTLKHVNKQKPLTVTNNVTRLVFVANQPVKVTTSYLTTDKV